MPIVLFLSIIALLIAAAATPVTIVLAMAWALIDPTGNTSHLMARWWGWMVVKGCFIRVTVIGRENIDHSQNYIFAANHASALDIPLLLAYLPIQFRWMAKEELFHIPFFGQAMKRCGYIPLNRTNPRESVLSLNRAADEIRSGRSVVIFPEGTRSRDGRVMEFKRGGFTLAVKSGRPIVPVAICGAARVLPAKTFRLRPGRIKIVIGHPIPTANLGRDGQGRLMEEVRQAIVAEVQPEIEAAKMEPPETNQIESSAGGQA